MLRKRRVLTKRLFGRHSPHAEMMESFFQVTRINYQVQNSNGYWLFISFRDQGYLVKEVGIGGHDGGFILVIIDMRGEKTAVQAKCYHNQRSCSGEEKP